MSSLSESKKQGLLSKLRMLDRLNDYETHDNFKTLSGYIGHESIVKLPDLFFKIADCTFEDNKNIRGIITNKHLMYVDERAFSNCINLESVRLNEGLYRIRTNAFTFTNIKDITIPSTVEVIAGNAFYSERLRDIYVLSSHLTVEDIYSACSCCSKFDFEGKIRVHFKKDRNDIEQEKKDYEFAIDLFNSTDDCKLDGFSKLNEAGDLLELYYDL